MGHGILKSVLSFVLVLVLTVVTVSTLSMATAAKTETASVRYSQQVRESQAPQATELSANVPEASASPLVSFGAFALILVVPGSGVWAFLRARKKGRRAAEHEGRRYSPRADMAFSGASSAKTRV